MKKESLSVVFLHPDLGIGGAERLVVDAALALQSKGHRVAFVTAHHAPPHCFPETADGTLAVSVAGAAFPRSLFGRCIAFCAYVRMILAAIWILWPWRDHSTVPRSPDVVFVDQVSAPVPLLRLCGLKILFYCHFPDLLLSQPGSALKAFYRAPLNWLEETSTGAAHRILVNSNFTKGVFRETFRRLGQSRVDVLYPTLATDAFDKPLEEEESGEKKIPPKPFFLSLNRFERKKRVGLAIKAMDALREKLPADVYQSLRLVIAGGYDERVRENVEHYAELRRLAAERGLSEKCIFLRSPEEATKRRLLADCHGLLYTPDREHFGIVPLEAAYSGRPVVAVASGGPLETVEEGVSGFLCEQTPEAFATAMASLVLDPARAAKMGKAGRKRVQDNFTADIFAVRLEDICLEVAA